MQKSCFLFGHADTPQSVLPALEQAIESEVANDVTTFYVGYHGSFDRLAATALRRVKQEHNEVTAILVLAYHPAERPIEIPVGFDGTFYPPLENTPRKIALIKANQYMVKTSDSIICYVKHFGNTRRPLKTTFWCFGREILVGQKFWKVRNTWCIADFSKRIVGAKDPPKTQKGSF